MCLCSLKDSKELKSKKEKSTRHKELSFFAIVALRLCGCDLWLSLSILSWFGLSVRTRGKRSLRSLFEKNGGKWTRKICDAEKMEHLKASRTVDTWLLGKYFFSRG